MKKSSENLLKMVRVECAQIIIFSFNDNRKFLINKNACLNISEAAEIGEHQLNLFTSAMRISTPFSALVSKGDEPDCLLC